MSSKEIEELIKKQKVKITKCAPDPRLFNRTGYELAMRSGASGMGRLAARAQAKEEWLEKKRRRKSGLTKRGLDKIQGLSKEKTALKNKRKRRAKMFRKMKGLGITERQANFLRMRDVKNPERYSRSQAAHLIGRIMELERQQEKEMALAMERDGE